VLLLEAFSKYEEASCSQQDKSVDFEFASDSSDPEECAKLCFEQSEQLTSSSCTAFEVGSLKPESCESQSYCLLWFNNSCTVSNLSDVLLPASAATYVMKQLHVDSPADSSADSSADSDQVAAQLDARDIVSFTFLSVIALVIVATFVWLFLCCCENCCERCKKKQASSSTKPVQAHRQVELVNTKSTKTAKHAQATTYAVRVQSV
jgi:hypothetical protein